MNQNHFQVIIVGAGPGGLSTAVALLDSGITDVAVLEKGEIGQAWLDYPTDTHLLSESTEQKDDNMIGNVPTSEVFPHMPHPSHILYQKYLEYVASQKHVNVIFHTQVENIMYNPAEEQFIVSCRNGQEFLAEFVVWAGGLFSTPNEELDCEGCYIHYAHMPYLPELDDTEVTVVGSANGASGVIMQLARPGRVVTLVTSKPYVVPEPIDCLWKEQAKFIKDLEMQGLVKIVENFRVKRIYEENTQFILESEDNQQLKVPHRPIICTGFLPNIAPVKQLVAEYCEGHETFLALDEAHQSKQQPRLFVAGAIGKRTADEGFIAKFREFGEKITKDIRPQILQ